MNTFWELIKEAEKKGKPKDNPDGNQLFAINRLRRKERLSGKKKRGGLYNYKGQRVI